MARPLSSLSDVALEAKFKACGSISTKARMNTGPAFSLIQSRHGLSRPTVFSSTQGLPRHRKCLEESIGATNARIASRSERPVGRQLGSNGAGPAPGIAVIRGRFYDLHAVMATLFRCL